MDSVRFQTPYTSSISKLGCPHDQTDSLSSFQIRAVSLTRPVEMATYLIVIHRKYFVTMGLRSMKWDEWIGMSQLPSVGIYLCNTGDRFNLLGRLLTRYIELDNQYPRFHTDKARRIKERGHKCCKTAPEAMDGAIELLEELYVNPSPLSFFWFSLFDLTPADARISPHGILPCSKRPTWASTTSSRASRSTSCSGRCQKTP